MTRILIVDDDPYILNASGRMWKHHGEVTTARSAEEALCILSGAAFDIVVSDLNMPGGDGLWLLGQVSSVYPSVSCVLMSGATRPAVLDRIANSDQVQHFIAKPASADDIDACMEALSTGRPLGGAI